MANGDRLNAFLESFTLTFHIISTEKYPSLLCLLSVLKLLSHVIRSLQSELCNTCSIFHCKIFPKEWPFGLAGCQAHVFMIFLFALIYIIHLGTISVGKYLTIKRSLTKHFYFKKEKSTFEYLRFFDLLTLVQRDTTGRMVELRPGRNNCYVQAISHTLVWSYNFYLLLFLLRDQFLLLQDPSSCQTDSVANTCHRSSLAMASRQALLKKHYKSAFILWLS